ncbi:MAG: hypothetical protein LIO51_02025 [Clostridiales bacterium]|nr:hypothetical protein [Clostridiales bacterium]
MASTAEKWVKRVKQASENFEVCLEENWTDDTCGWGARLRTLWDQDDSLRPLGLLLTGPEGCGRHTAAAHVVRFLWGREFGSIWLSGHDLLSDGGLSAARERLNGLFDDFYNQKKGLCLVVERLEGWDDREELLAYLGQSLWDYWLMREEYPPLFLILIDSGRNRHVLLRVSLQLCRMTPPNREQRLRFLENRGADSGLTKYVAADAFADAAEGLSYAQLLDLMGNLCMLVCQTARGVTPKELTQLVAEQRGEPFAIRSAQRRAALEEALLKLANELPELLRNAPLPQSAVQPMVQPTPPVIPEPIPEPPPVDDTDLTYEELERMSVKQVTCKLFGEERGNRLIQAVHEKTAASEPAAEEEKLYVAS